MPLSEFLRLAIEKLEASKKKSCSTDLSSRTENNLVEVVWENGPTHHSLSPNTPSVRDAVLGTSTTERIENLDGVETLFNDNSPVVPSGQLDLSQNDEVVPWLSCPVDDGGLRDYCSERLPEISSVTAKGTLAGNSFTSGGKGSRCDQAVGNLDDGQDVFKVSSCKARSLCSWLPQQGQTSDPSRLSGVSSIITDDKSGCQDGLFGNCVQGRDVTSDSSSMKMESQNIGQPTHNSNLLNFSRFSRPEILLKANLPVSGGISSSVSSSVKRMDVKEKGPASRCNNPVKSKLIDRLNSKQKDMDFYVPSAPTVVSSGQLLVKEPKESFIAERTENFSKDTPMKTDKALTQSNTANSTRILDGDRTVEPIVASSSLGSGNSADRVSYEQTHNLKRKFESECHSDDIQTECGVKKPTPAHEGTGSKRSRSAEVHNLSERRRRDRINEKMRALQELIPNCNKADKASMLDDAIQYLKNLQHQVLIMSMGAGLCIPPMMFPPGSPHMYPTPIPHFSPIGVGMGMSMSFGNINRVSPQCPIFPVPSIQGTRFPSSALGLTNLLGIPSPNLPIHGHLCPGFHTTVPRAPLIPLTGSHHSVSRISSQNEVPSTSPNLNSEDPMTNKNSQNTHNAEASSSINPASNQLKAKNEVSNQAADALTSTEATEISKETGSD